MGADWPFQGSLSEPQLLNYGVLVHYLLILGVWGRVGGAAKKVAEGCRPTGSNQLALQLLPSNE